MNLQDFIKKHENVSVDEDDLKELLGIKDEKYFIPEEGEGYFAVNLSGDIYEGEVCDAKSHSNLFEERFKNHEVFRTKEEAEEHAKKQRFLLKMKRDFLDNSYEIDWEDDYQVKYNIYYNSRRDIVTVEGWTMTDLGVLVTTNREWLKEYIEKYEEEIKKYYFGIKEEK